MAAFITAGSPATTSAESAKELDQNLPHARSIYLCQLAETVAPYILKVLKSMYSQVLSEGSSRITQRFQEKLNAIPLWNSSIVGEHASHLESKVPYIGDLITAAFVSYVKVMSSIKLRPGKPNIRLQLPTNAAFLHKAFTYVARDFYYAPKLITHVQQYQDQMPMYMAFDRTIRHMLPQKEILKAYLGNSVDEEHTVSPTLDNEYDDDRDEEDEADAGDTPEPFQPAPAPFQPPPAPPASFQPAATPETFQPASTTTVTTATTDTHSSPTPTISSPVPPVCETKTISLPPTKDDDLFSDADDADTDWKH